MSIKLPALYIESTTIAILENNISRLITDTITKPSNPKQDPWRHSDTTEYCRNFRMPAIREMIQQAMEYEKVFTEANQLHTKHE